MDPTRELDCVRRAQGRDPAAFEELIRGYARIVWAAVYGMTPDPSWTEDLVQETFLRAWASMDELKEPAAFRGWLLTIARRLTWRHAEVMGRVKPMAEIPEAPAPFTPPDPEEDRERVQAALSRLPERYRLPVTLHFVNGMEYQAIAQATGMANGALRGLIHRGVAKLRAELTPWWRKRHEHS
ncbi:MAG: sigma-70 family RNA polymerase sigma factor [Planctomycetes bacterium]|nr:sigma-70 family RNA polymerase sigma factor [Planctomycetota bacterium]